MNTPTLYLNLVILLASAFPSGFGTSIHSVFSKKHREKIDTTALAFMFLPFFILLPAIFTLKKDVFFLNLPPGFFNIIAVVMVPVCLFLEYILNMFYIYFKGGKISKGITITLHSAWKTRLSVPYLCLITLIAVGEEIIYRQVWFALLDKTFNLPVMIIILLTSLIYGLNHFYFGFNSVLAKFISGSVYGVFYVISGYSIVVPIIIHVLQNISLILITREKNV
jgi:hypothetical protein